MPWNEADTRAKLITPALHRRGWVEDMICREERPGGIEIVGNKGIRRSLEKSDYVLRLKIREDSQPVAVALIEAKKESLPPAHGIEQAKGYAELFNVSFVFSSNGHRFVEYDRSTGKTGKARPMAEFPTPDELRRRYEARLDFSLDDKAAKPLLTPYPGGEGKRRYYQDAAIRAVLEKIAACKGSTLKRALLPLATGSGKTFIAVNLLKRIDEAGELRRALFLCDRDELRQQALTAFHNVFGDNAAVVRLASDGKNAAHNARIHIATYQTLGVDTEDGEASFLTEHYPPDAFSHIIIDECHRSAWNKWSEVLKRNRNAVQIGLTATPRTLGDMEEVLEHALPEGGMEQTRQAVEQDWKITADNIEHFGKPVYSYSLTQGAEDGYLAACIIRQSLANLDERGLHHGEIMEKGPRDHATGEIVSSEKVREAYEKRSFESTIMLPDRVKAMCADLFSALLDSGEPEQKTIIFCVRDDHADMVTGEMNNLYAEWCNENNRVRAEPYSFKCTASVDGVRHLPDFRNSTKHHFIATTVDLLTTGVDVPCVNNIAFFRYVRSPISLHQMMGRGARLHEASGKLMFTVHDYTNATDLLGKEMRFPAPNYSEPEPGSDTDKEEPHPKIEVDGFKVYMTETGNYTIVQEDGQTRRISMEEYRQRLADKLAGEVRTLEDLRQRWVVPEDRRALLDKLRQSGCSADALRTLQDMEDYDLYDILADLGFGMSPHTRAERAEAFSYKHEDWLNRLPSPTAEALRAIVRQFREGGIEELERQGIFETPDLKKAGGVDALKMSGHQPKELIQSAKEKVLSA